MVRRVFILTFILLFCFAVQLPAADEPGELNKPNTPAPAATVNDHPVSYETFVEGLIRRHGRQYLEELIVDALLEQEFATHNIQATPKEVMAEIDRDVANELIRRDTQSKEQYNVPLAEWLNKQGSSVRLMRSRLIKDRDANKSLFVKQVKADKLVGYSLIKQDRVRVRHILFNKESEAFEQLRNIDDTNQDATFDSIWEELMGSAAPGAAELPPFSRGDHQFQNIRPLLHHLGAEFENIAFSLKTGDYSKPFQTKAGWHILKVVTRYPAQEGSYAKLRSKVKQMLTTVGRPTAIDYDAWIAKKRKVVPILRSKKLLELFDQP